MTARRRSLLTCAAIAALGVGGTAWAQDAEPVQLAQMTGEYLDRIVVTSTRSERQLRVNVGNIAVMEAEELDLIGPHVASEALNRLPGVNVMRGSGQEHLTSIRSPVLTAGAGAGSFLYLEQGVPLRAAGFANVNGLFEAIEEIGGGIEVIRGPGGALYGSNAVHGMINFLVREPSADPESYLEASYGSFDRFTTRGWTSRTIGDEGSGYFIGFSGLSDGGFRAQSGVDDQKLTGRFDFNRGRITSTTVLSFVNMNQETAGYAEGPRAYEDEAIARGNINPEAYRDSESLRWSTRIDVEQGDWTFSATPFARKTDMIFLQHFLPYKAIEENGHWSLGSQFAAYRRMDRGQIILGADVEYTEGYLVETQTLPSFGAFPTGVHYDFDVDALVLAPYVHAEYELTDRLRLEGGLRYEATEYDYVTNVAPGTRGRFRVPDNRTDEYETVTPNIGLAYDFNEQLIGWVKYTRGARAPQTSDLYRLQNLQTVGDIKEEALDSFETGVRGEMGDAAFEIVGFYMDKDNFFFRDADGLNVPNGKTRHVGVEATASLPINDVLTLNGSATYAEHTYRFDRPVGNASERISFGDDVDGAPHFLASAQLVWIPVENVTAELSWTHVSEYFTDAANQRTYPGHDVFDLRARWQINDRFNVFGAVRNLLDEEYAERADFGNGVDRYFPGEPRAVQVGFGASF